MKILVLMAVTILCTSCNTKKDFQKLVNTTSKNKQDVIKSLGEELSPNYLRLIEKYTEAFLELDAAIINFSDRSLKKIKKEYVEEICEKVLLTKEDLENLQQDCTHPHFKFCPEAVYQMKEILASLTKRVRKFHDLDTYSKCRDRLGE